MNYFQASLDDTELYVSFYRQYCIFLFFLSFQEKEAENKKRKDSNFDKIIHTVLHNPLFIQSRNIKEKVVKRNMVIGST